MRNFGKLLSLLVGLGLWNAALAKAGEPAPAPPDAERQLVSQLDAPLLFVKRQSYTGIHIYDTYYKWPAPGGGIYVLENPAAPREQWKIRPVIDPTTPGTLGTGIYTHPELSWDAKKLLFCFKGEATGSTSIYEIGIDGQGLRRLTDPTPTCNCYHGSNGGQHDIAPAYLPDGRIVFLSTRPSGLVPCANEGVSILHVMNADGSDMHPISVNNVNEFDPSVMSDGRILFGRWEYVDKNALTIQSLWSINPDGTNETAVYANNMVFPEAILDARAVPDSPVIVGTFAKHNAPPRGSIALVDTRLGKNGPQAIVNLEHPEDPTCDRGDSCEPWPVTAELFLYSGRPAGSAHNVLQLIDRDGRRATLLADPAICLHSPMLVKPRPVPAVIQPTIDRTARTGRFFVQDIYRGLSGVQRGEVRWLRVIEETSRVSATPGGGNPYNQTFLVSAALAFSVKNYLGVVPVDEHGSAYFEVPSGRAVYLQALDADGRLIQSMRTFVQAAPGATRSCIGCHEHKATAAANANGLREVLGRTPAPLKPESWGSGYLDYPSLVQPILDRHCVRCHGGQEGVAAGLDLSGGWTEHFNISYENLANRRQTQLVAYWINGIDCMNGTAFWSAQLFGPRSHGSGAAPLAQLLLSGHDGQIPNLSRRERDLLMAWIDSNGLYYGSWDYTKHGCAIRDWKSIKDAVIAEMGNAGCLRCHGNGQQIALFENDWINLREPQHSRLLRAPLAAGGDGYGLGLCRDRKIDPSKPRLRLLWNGYAHAVQPIEAFAPKPLVPWSTAGEPVVTLASTSAPHYQALLAAIRQGRERALAAPRVDMPGAEVIAGACRQFLPPPLPSDGVRLDAVAEPEGVVQLAWERSARTIGLEAEVHRGPAPNFVPGDETLLVRTTLGQHADKLAPVGPQHYALVLVSGSQRSQPVYATVTVPNPPPPPAPAALQAASASHSVRLQWPASRGTGLSYRVYRAKPGAATWDLLTPEPVRQTSFTDGTAAIDAPQTYVVRAISQRGAESEGSPPATAQARVIQEPVFVAAFGPELRGLRPGGEAVPGKVVGKARGTGDVLDLQQGGHVAFPHAADFDLDQPLSIECWVWFDQPGQMPVVLSCGLWNHAGWFLQRIGAGWRWHVGGIDCDGGQAAVGRWLHVVGTYDGRTTRLFQDGVLLAERAGAANTSRWPGDLCIGQYSPHQGPEFQVTGRMAGVKIYHRPLAAAEVAEAAKKPPAANAAK